MAGSPEATVWPGPHFQQAGEVKQLRFSVAMPLGHICGYHTPMLIHLAPVSCVKNIFSPLKRQAKEKTLPQGGGGKRSEDRRVMGTCVWILILLPSGTVISSILSLYLREKKKKKTCVVLKIKIGSWRWNKTWLLSVRHP